MILFCSVFPLWVLSSCFSLPVLLLCHCPLHSLHMLWDLDRYRSQHFPIRLLWGFSAVCWSLWKCPMEMEQEKVSVCVLVTWDICGRRLISLRLTACGSKLLSNWQSSTPSLRAWAKSHTFQSTNTHTKLNWGTKTKCVLMCRCLHVFRFTCAPSHVTRWFSGRTRQSISHIAHCRHNSIFVFWTTNRLCSITSTIFSNQWSLVLCPTPNSSESVCQIISQCPPDN